MADLLELKDVTALRAGKRALDRVSLRIRAKENVAIIGPNGSGKSTLIKLLTRELYPVAIEGPFTLKLLGRERWELMELRKHLGIVSPDLQVDFAREMTGLEAVVSGFFGSVGLWDNRQVLESQIAAARRALDRVGAAYLADRWMTEMSSGEARRILIARALIHEPEAVLLDEPTTSLDFRAHLEFRATTRKLAKRGTSILLVTHMLEDVIPEIERVVLLRRGVIFKDGAAEEVLTSEHLSELFETRVRLRHDDGIWRLA
ncbi:MAG TPA: ATP-binding cassette domain-containing protein [Planctomycetota bacterium]